MEEIIVKSKKKQEIIDITSKIEEKVKNVKDGIVTIFTPHSTAAIIINENWDPNILIDTLNALDKLIPAGVWLHDKVDNNGAAHIKAAILGPSETIIIKNGKLLLGKWQAIMLADFDGPKERKVFIRTS